MARVRLFSILFAILFFVNIDISAQTYFPNLAGDANVINFEDFVVFANNWQQTGSELAGDFDDSGKVDFNDLKIFCDYWLFGAQPAGEVFELFKAALAIGDIDGAVFYFADFVADDYRTIFNENTGELQDMVNDMGNLSLKYKDGDIAVYEISNIAGTNFFPVVFTMDDNGQWKIAVF
jgi:hypothetical protein